jgi:hypothetical protein
VEVIEVTNDRLLGDVVRAWVEIELPGDPGIADRAAARARIVYRDGASVTEACHEAMELVGSWVRHPSHRREERNGMVALAS